MNYYQISTFSDTSVSSVQTAFYRDDLFEHNIQRALQNEKLSLKNKNGESVSSFIIMPCHWKFENNIHIKLNPPIITDIAHMGFVEDGKYIQSICLSSQALKAVEPYLQDDFRLLTLKGLINGETKEIIDKEYYLLLVPFINISEKINFEKSVFIFYENATNPSNPMSKKVLKSFTKLDFNTWVEQYYGKLMKQEWNGIYIEKLVLKDNSFPFFSLTPYFWHFKSILFNENIINQWKEVGITGLAVEEVACWVEGK